MKIVFDVSYVQKNRAGIGRHALQLLRTLLKSDKENEYTLHGWSWGIDRRAISDVAGSNKVSVARIPGDVRRFYWNRLRFPPIEAFVGCTDLFHSADPFLPPVRRAKTICTVHDLAYKRFPQMFEKRVVAWDSFVTASLDRADVILVPSLQTKSDLVELFQVSSERIHLVQLPVDSVFTPEAQANDELVKRRYRLEKPYVLFVGTIEPRKNVARIVKAFAAVQQETGADIELVLVGKQGWLFEETFKEIAASRSRQRIRYLNFVPDEELSSIYRQALCFVYPSHYEGYGFPVLEAMASGIPVITSNNSSMREIADGVALLVDPMSGDDIAEALSFLITNEVRRMEMRRRGQMVIEQLSNDRSAESVLALYRTLLGGSGVR